MIETTQETRTKVSMERRYFIASAGVNTVGEFARAVRAHWGDESMHWVLDVTFREDACRVRKDHAARNLATVHKITLAMLRLDTCHPDRSFRRRRVLAHRKTEFREELLGLRPRCTGVVGLRSVTRGAFDPSDSGLLRPCRPDWSLTSKVDFS